MGGDFNCPLNTLLDKKGGIMILRKSVVAGNGCIQSELDFVDIWRFKNPSLKVTRGVRNLRIYFAV